MTDGDNGPSITFRFEGDPKPKREYCAKCCQAYLPENLSECISCNDLLCYECTELVIKPGAKVKLACICGTCKRFKAGWWNNGKVDKPKSSLLY
jgi:hypothetical protein